MNHFYSRLDINLSWPDLGSLLGKLLFGMHENTQSPKGHDSKKAEGNEGTEVYCISNTLWWLFKDSGRFVGEFKGKSTARGHFYPQLKSVNVASFRFTFMASQKHAVPKIHRRKKSTDDILL